jgi:hypothetical protein
MAEPGQPDQERSGSDGLHRPGLVEKIQTFWSHKIEFERETLRSNSVFSNGKIIAKTLLFCCLWLATAIGLVKILIINMMQVDIRQFLW